MYLRRFIPLVFLVGLSAAAQGPEPLTITTVSLSRANLRQPYTEQLKTRGGTSPMRWELAAGALPRGIRLVDSGRLVGSPQEAGNFQVTVRVTDSFKPPHSAERVFVLQVTTPLAVEWKIQPFAENNNAIRGSVRLINGTDESFDLTLIVVAVNEVGKAFALGYQRFNFAAQTTSDEIPFGSTLPAGNYLVHVDAVAEAPSQNVIYRARLQTQLPLSVSGLP